MSPAPTPSAIRLTFDSPSLERLLAEHLGDVGPGGMFIRSETPPPVGATLVFEFLLRGAPCFSGEGTVVWSRESGQGAGSPPGMGLRFDRLGQESQDLLQRLLLDKRKRTGGADGRIAEGADGVPEFLDDSGRPTVRVAADRVSRLVAATADAGQDTKSTMKLDPVRVAALVAASRQELVRQKEAQKAPVAPPVVTPRPAGTWFAVNQPLGARMERRILLGGAALGLLLAVLVYVLSQI